MAEAKEAKPGKQAKAAKEPEAGAPRPKSGAATSRGCRNIIARSWCRS